MSRSSAGRLRLPVHSDVESQELALMMFKEKSDSGSQSLKKFKSKIQASKQSSEALKFTRQWIIEHEALHSERCAAEVALGSALQYVDDALFQAENDQAVGTPSLRRCRVLFRQARKEDEERRSLHAEYVREHFASVMSLKALINAVPSPRKGTNPQSSSVIALRSEFPSRLEKLREQNQLEVNQLCKELEEAEQMPCDASIRRFTSSSTTDALQLEMNRFAEYPPFTIAVGNRVCKLEEQVHASLGAAMSDEAATNGKARVSELIKQLIVPSITKAEEFDSGLRSFRATFDEAAARLSTILSADEFERVKYIRTVSKSQSRRALVDHASAPSANRSSADVADRIVFELHCSRSTAERAITECEKRENAVAQTHGMFASAVTEFKKALSIVEEAATNFGLILIEEWEYEKQKSEREKELESLREEVAQLRQQRDEQQTAKREQLLEEERLEKEKALRAEERKRFEHEEHLKQLAVWRDAKAASEAEKLSKQQESAAMERHASGIRAAKNAERVSFRQLERERKLHERGEEKYYEQCQQEEHQSALDDFFRNIEKRIGAQRDVQRAIAPTVSSGASVRDDFVPIHEKTRANIHGYTDDRLQRDPRFRLQQALVSAGLHQTAYGRTLLAQPGARAGGNVTSKDNPLRL